MIQNIAVDLIRQHPDNPRKNLGDLTELADSIRANGIFQNLTVIPAEGNTYTVVIGHRRLAAAKLAGLAEVPCAVVEMDYKTQLSTMLLENMQRSDLTPFEQAQGFQMMFDLGVTAQEIAEKTGFSEKTVRKRLKIAALPADMLQDAQERGATLEDFVKISEIKSAEDREKLLDEAGTRDFDFTYNRILTKQAIEETKPKIVKEVMRYANPAPDVHSYCSSKYENILTVNIQNYKPGDATPKEIDPKQTYFFEFSYYDVYIMVKAQKKKSEPVQKSPKEREANRRREELKRLCEEARQLRQNFMLNYTADKDDAEIIHAAILNATPYLSNYGGTDWDVFLSAIGHERRTGANQYEAVAEELKSCRKSGLTKLALTAYSLYNDDVCTHFYEQNYGSTFPKSKEDQKMTMLYAFLTALGYQRSTMEIQLMTGTHKLFEPWEGEEDDE